MDRTVVFVCAHGAGRSRIAAAWFNTDPPPGWHATTAAGEDPAPALNPRAEQLLAGLPAHDQLDHSPPRPLAAVNGADLTIAIDCAVPGAHQWTLTATQVDDAMRVELRDRVTALSQAIRAGHLRGDSTDSRG
jgi:protein-tyrosine-phosphatase